MNKHVVYHVNRTMHETQPETINNEQYVECERSISEQPIEAAPASLAAMQQAVSGNVEGTETLSVPAAAAPAKPAVFEHETSTQVVLSAFLAIGLFLSWEVVRLPLGSSGIGLAALALVGSGYLAFRLFLTLQSVSINESGFELRAGNHVDRVSFQEIRNVRFDRVSHDLIVETTKKSFRIARTLQGHRVIRQRLLTAVPAEPMDDSHLLLVKPRVTPRAAGTLGLCAMAICVSTIMWLNPLLGALNFLGLLLPTYVLFDRCIRRSYRLDQDGIEIRGIWSPRFHARGELVHAHISKGALSSTLKLDFGSETVELDEYLLGQSLVEVSEFIERNWSVRVNPSERRSGVHSGVTTELT